MKLTVLALAGALCLMAFGAQAASVMVPNMSADSGLIQQAHVICAYLTSDGYCVGPRSVHRHQGYYRHLYPYHHDNGLHRGWYKHHRAPIVQIVPAYPPHYYDRGNDDWDE